MPQPAEPSPSHAVGQLSFFFLFWHTELSYDVHVQSMFTSVSVTFVSLFKHIHIAKEKTHNCPKLAEAAFAFSLFIFHLIHIKCAPWQGNSYASLLAFGLGE